ncbi:MAG TPA: tetratricopeptide repeat protein [Bacteroidia bacterium]|nr:tetratricopeptide repeat protein [Bacteroidia bacterium]
MPEIFDKLKGNGIIIPLLAFTISMVLRKLGWLLGPFMVILCGIWLFIHCIRPGIKIVIYTRKTESRWLLTDVLLYSFCFGLILFQQQYWIHGPGLTKLAGLIFIIGIIHKNYAASDQSKIQWLQLMPTFPRLYFAALIGILLFTGIFLSPKDFHNFYRVSTYEEFLRSQYPRISMEKADELLTEYNEQDSILSIKALKLADTAKQKEKEKDFKSALRYYNLAIDMDPFNPILYYQRGRFKISRLELNEDLANSAIIDFSESARMRPLHAESYFQRGVIYAYLDKKIEVCEDMQRAYELDPGMAVLPFVKKCCPEDSSRFMPLHP